MTYSKKSLLGDITSSQVVYVKKWMKTKHAIVFRLSNKVVQVNFEDASELVMSSVTKKVMYTNKKGQRYHYLLSTALESGNTEMIKRLNYSR
jgi:polo-like kinase 1